MAERESAEEPALARGDREPSRAACCVCGRIEDTDDLVPLGIVRGPVVARLREEHPDCAGDGFVCLDDLNRYRTLYVKMLLTAERHDVDTLEQSVLERIARHETFAEDVDRGFAEKRTLGERIADRVASFGGSWWFISSFGGFIVVWMTINSLALAGHAFDPFPYILLNLILSCLAAIQAPIIMMSQRRQEDRDRLRSRNDYLVNLKAELQIRLLHEKMDHLMRQQWDRLSEVQEIQLELLRELERPRRG